MGGKGGGSIDTSGMTSAMQAQTDISKQEMDLANRMFGYGVQRTGTYADPLLNEFARIMGYGPTAGSAQVPIPSAAPAAPAYAPGTAPGGAGGGMGGYSAMANMFIDPNTGQLYGGDKVTQAGPGAQMFANVPTGEGTTTTPILVQPYGQPAGGAAQNLGIGASVPWGGGTTGQAVSPPGGRYVSPVESSLFQLPVATSQAQLNQTIQSIMRTVPPGPQQTAMINKARNDMNQNLGQQAFGTVTNMMNALLGTSGAAQAGMQQAAGAMGAASASQAAAGQMASTITNLQMQAQQANNQMLGGIFGTIGQLGGMLGAAAMMA